MYVRPDLRSPASTVNFPAENRLSSSLQLVLYARFSGFDPRSAGVLYGTTFLLSVDHLSKRTLDPSPCIKPVFLEHLLVSAMQILATHSSFHSCVLPELPSVQVHICPHAGGGYWNDTDNLNRRSLWSELEVNESLLLASL
jgi:hypothetical protein